MRSHILRCAPKRPIVFASQWQTNDDLEVYQQVMDVGVAESPNRFIFIRGQASRNSNSSGTARVTALSVNGVNATVFAEAASTSSSNAVINAIALCPLPTGTTATISMRCSVVMSFAELVVGYYHARSPSISVLDTYRAVNASSYGSTMTTTPGGLVVVATSTSTTQPGEYVGLDLFYARPAGVGYPDKTGDRVPTQNSLTWSIASNTTNSCCCGLSIF